MGKHQAQGFGQDPRDSEILANMTSDWDSGVPQNMDEHRAASDLGQARLDAKNIDRAYGDS